MKGVEAERERARIHWQCRRGMRELDLLLEAFVREHYDALDGSQRRALQRLLECPDQLLLDYLLGRLVPSDREVAHVVARIRGAPAH